MHDSNFNVSTKNKYFISAKVFLRELYRLDYLDKDITINIKGFKQNQGHKKDGLSEDDILIIQEHCKTLAPTSDNLRLKALIVGVIPKVAASFFAKWPHLSLQSVHSVSLKSVQSADFKAF